MYTKDKHILILNRSFWPDIEATGQFLTELCERLAKSYRITVIAGRSYYLKDSFKFGRLYKQEILHGIEIIRVRHTKIWKANILGRIINWLTYGILAFIVALRIKPHLIIACTDPPFLGIIAMLISRLRHIPFIYNCRDLYPDGVLALGKLKKGFVSNSFDYLNRKALSAACFVVCLGASMKDRLIKKGIPESHIKVIPDWVDTSAINPVPKNNNPLFRKLGFKNKFIIMYSGNIGLSQDFSSILNSISMVKDRSCFDLVFIGDGAAKENLKEQSQKLGLENVLFFPYQPKDMLSFSLSMADLHIIPLKKGMSGMIIPSKVYGIMAAARPYLAITDMHSEPARIAKEFNCGLWAKPQDIEAITEIINWALVHPDELEEMGNRGRRVAERHFDKELIIKEWFKRLDETGS